MPHVPPSITLRGSIERSSIVEQGNSLDQDFWMRQPENFTQVGQVPNSPFHINGNTWHIPEKRRMSTTLFHRLESSLEFLCYLSSRSSIDPLDWPSLFQIMDQIQILPKVFNFSFQIFLDPLASMYLFQLCFQFAWLGLPVSFLSGKCSILTSLRWSRLFWNLKTNLRRTWNMISCQYQRVLFRFQPWNHNHAHFPLSFDT